MPEQPKILRRLNGAIAAGIRQAAADQGSSIRYHEHRHTPDLDWMYSQAQGIADYITTSTAWQELRIREQELAIHTAAVRKAIRVWRDNSPSDESPAAHVIECVEDLLELANGGEA